MARIRSIHPFIFTDEAFVSISPLARVFYIGLLTDADDNGVFEWKPLQLKMRILPAETSTVEPLLEELVGVDLIRPFDSAGKKLGGLRHFCKWQRPKKPTGKHPIPVEHRTYVGLNPDGSRPKASQDDEVTGEAGAGGEPVPHSHGTEPEISPQREEGGGKDGGEKLNPPTPLRGGARTGSEPGGAGWPSPSCEAAWKALPVDAQASSSPAQFGEAWRAMVPILEAEGRTGAEADLLFAACAAAKHFAQPGKAKRTPAAHRWLGTGKFRAFLPEVAPLWAGPIELRREVVAAIGEGGEAFARMMLDARCGWQDAPVKAVTCSTSWIRDKLAESPAAAVFERHGVALLRKAADA
jgi:hypothetical protein